MTRRFQIQDHVIGEDQPCYIIAELSCNHEGDLNEAIAIIEAAAQAGADAVKLQTYTADTITRNFKANCGDMMWGDTDLYDLYQKAYTPWEWYGALKNAADKHGLHIFSSPFDESAVDFLMKQEAPVFKVASFELVDTKLLEKIAATGKPVIFSNGMSTYAEMLEAYVTLRKYGAEDIAILHCNGGYPPPFDTANLATIPAIHSLFPDCIVGLSDHTLFADTDNYKDAMAHICPVEAVKLGAKIVEVHLTLDRGKARNLFEKNEGGYDWAFSRNPDELKQTIDSIRAYERGEEIVYETSLEKEMAQQAHGQVMLEPTPKEMTSREYRPVLWVVEDIEAGAPLFFAGGESGKYRFHPWNESGEKGLHVRYADFIHGQKAAYDLKAGQVLTWPMITQSK